MTTQGDRRRPPHSQGVLLMHITSEEYQGNTAETVNNRVRVVAGNRNWSR